MKKLSKKSALLFAAVMALCAFAMPSMASAASWGVVGTSHVLDGPGLSLNIPALSAGSTCTQTQFNTDVRTAATLIVTSASFTGCSGTGNATGCTVTATGSGLPWTGTPTSTTSATVDAVHVSVRFETTPGSATCAFNGSVVTVTGRLHGTWDAAAHQITFASAAGLTGHVNGMALPVTVTGTLRDTSQSLTLS